MIEIVSDLWYIEMNRNVSLFHEWVCFTIAYVLNVKFLNTISSFYLSHLIITSSPDLNIILFSSLNSPLSLIHPFDSTLICDLDDCSYLTGYPIHNPIAIQFGVDLTLLITICKDSVYVFSEGQAKHVEIVWERLCLSQNGERIEKSLDGLVVVGNDKIGWGNYS